MYIASFISACLASALIFGIRFQEDMRSFVAAAHRKFPGEMTAYLGERISQFFDGFLPLRRLDVVLGAIVTTTVI
jgi:hypothetical protein